MKVAILSGKGGAGKTLLAVNLAAIAEEGIYIDCDVEEPNGHLFFKPVEEKVIDVVVKMPKVNDYKCDGCRVCTDFCNYNALAYIANKILVFEEVCHSCGGCTLLCPQNAIYETDKVIGKIVDGSSEDTRVVSGFLNVGEATGVPIINQIMAYTKDLTENVIIDCPPGSACVVMESIKEADYCVLVAEPTIFGIHNMQMVQELVTTFKKPFGVVINKAYESINPATAYCEENQVNVLGTIPFNEDLGLLNSNGLIAVRENWEYKSLFKNILSQIQKGVQDEAATLT